ncbi:MAG TPA: FAD-dependent oxidoreductase [Solirubrobacteraceae bacterium]|nr:FAD-dependent oxidoreductase [Solirubrobacteraceae bacterium]
MKGAGHRYDLVVLGGGTAGLVSSMIAAAAGARVALIERGRTGGDCLWTGCVPSKSLIAAAGLAHHMRHAASVGLEPVQPRIDFSRVMEHVARAIATIAPHDSPERLRDAGVEVIEAEARFVAPGRIETAGRTLRWRTAIIATGSHPVLPPLDGLDQAQALTTETVWDLRELPRRLVVLGGGPIGCELAQAFARLGSQVTLVEMADRLLLEEEPEASALIADRLHGEDVDVRTQTRAVAVRDRELLLEGGETLAFDRVLVAAGRAPRTAGIGLDRVGVNVDGRGAIIVDDRLRTSGHGIYAAGDVTGGLAFTHVAGHHARVAASNALFHTRSTVSGTIPWVTFTDPEVARVGLSEAQARERWGERVKIARFDFARSDRAITSGEAYGFAKLVADSRGRLVGATIASAGGGEAIAELTAWVSQGAKLAVVSRTVHAYPTLAEGPARAADEHLAARYGSPRMRAAARPVLAVLRAVEGPR